MKGEHDFPLRENCDPTDPYEAYLWMLVAPPMVRGAPLLMPVSYLREMSKRIWDLNGPPNKDWKPRLKYRPPSAGDPHWMTSPGYWENND